MLTLRPLPGRTAPGNSLLAAYHAGLRRHWPIPHRLLGRLLAAAGRGGWSPAERHLLAPAIRAGGLNMADRKGLHRLLNPGAFPLAANPLKNKQIFARRADAAALPAGQTHDALHMDLCRWLAGQQDVVAKPSFRSKGRGVVRYRRHGDLWDGRLDDAALAALLLPVQRQGGVIQRGLPTDPALADISPGALPTLRIVTCLDEGGVPEPCVVALRLSAGGGRPVDNFNAGNLVAALGEDGTCAAAWWNDGGPVPARCATHPLTGAPIAGRHVAGLAEATHLAVRAHHVFRTGFTVIGWDIGLTAQGPVLIEGNWNPGTDIVQLADGRGLADTRLGALYRHHLGLLSPADWRAAGPVQGEPRHS